MFKKLYFVPSKAILRKISGNRSLDDIADQRTTRVLLLCYLLIRCVSADRLCSQKGIGMDTLPIRRSPTCQECGRCFDLQDPVDSKAVVDWIAREVIQRVRERVGPMEDGDRKTVVGVSVRHVHLTRDALGVLYGPSRELKKMRDLYQPGQFAAEEAVAIVGPRMRTIERVRILGPLRDHTQVELSRTDGFTLGLELPVRHSGDIAGTPGVTLSPRTS